MSFLDRRRGGEREVAGRREAQARAAAPGVVVVDVVLASRRQAGLIDVAAVGDTPSNQSHRQHVGHNRQIDHAVEVVVGSALPGLRHFAGKIAAECAAVGLVGDDADRARFRRGAVERSLRPLEHFDAGDIVQFEIDVAAAAVVFIVGADDGLVVISADGRGPGRVDPADDIFLVAWPEVLKRQARNARGIFAELGNARLGERVARQRLDCDRHVS